MYLFITLFFICLIIVISIFSIKNYEINKNKEVISRELRKKLDKKTIKIISFSIINISKIINNIQIFFKNIPKYLISKINRFWKISSRKIDYILHKLFNILHRNNKK